MNLYLRLLWVLISGLRKGQQELLEEVTVDFRVLPHDCDLNLHLTNARYSSFLDLSRMHATGRYRLLLRLLRRRWLPVIDAQEISYLRALAPGEKFQISTQLVGWTESHFFFKHRVFNQRGAAAVGYARGLFMHHRKIVPMQDVIGLVSEETTSPELPAEIVEFHQRAAEKRTRYRRRLRNGPMSRRPASRGARTTAAANANGPNVAPDHGDATTPAANGNNSESGSSSPVSGTSTPASTPNPTRH